MAEVCTVIGAAAAAGQIITTVWQTIHTLRELRRQYKAANRSIGLLLNRLATVESALSFIREWSNDDQVVAPEQHELRENLNNAMDGCKEAMDALAEDVSAVSARTKRDALTIRDRARFVWSESTMRDHEDILQRQVSNLQLMVIAVQCRTTRERTQLFAKEESKSIMQEVKIDTASIRASKSAASAASESAPSVRSGGTSSVDARTYGFDAELIDSTPYQNARISQRKSFLRRVSRNSVHVEDCEVGEREQSDHASITETPMNRVVQFVSEQIGNCDATENASIKAEIPSVDEGYVSRSASAGSKRSEKSSQHHNAAAHIEPASVYRSRSLKKSLPLLRTKSDRSINHEPPEKLQGFRRRLSMFSLRRRSNSSLSTPKSPQSLERQGSRCSRQTSQRNIHKSIDFTSNEGLAVPQLIIAAQSGSVVEVEKLLDRGADMEVRHERTGRTALAVAAHCGNDRIVQVLLQAGALIDQRDNSNQTALHLASSRGHFEVMKLLIEDFASLEARDCEGKTPLWLATSNGYLDAVNLLLSSRSRVNTRCMENLTPLHCAAMMGDTDLATLIVSYGADADARDGSSMAAVHHASERGHEQIVAELICKRNVEAPGRKGRTPLICAAITGHQHVVDLVLRRGAKIKSKDEDGNNALHLASLHGHTEVVEHLLQKKLPINGTNNEGQTALHLAITGQHFDVVELLIRRRAALEQHCSRGYSPLHYACSARSVDIVQILIAAGAKIGVQTTFDSATPLHIATLNGQSEIVNILLRQRVQLDARDQSGDRPLFIACADGKTDIAEALIEAGSPIQMKPTGKDRLRADSPLCIAAREGHRDVCALLIKHGASIRQRDEHEWTALRYAAYYGNPAVVELLLSNGAEISANATALGGCEITVANVGFANNTDISEERKARVLQLLHDAEEAEVVARQIQNNGSDDRMESSSQIHGLSEATCQTPNNGGDESDALHTPQTWIAAENNLRRIYSKRYQRSPPPSEPELLGASWKRETMGMKRQQPTAKPLNASEYPEVALTANSQSVRAEDGKCDDFRTEVPTPTVIKSGWSDTYLDFFEQRRLSSCAIEQLPQISELADTATKADNSVLDIPNPPPAHVYEMDASSMIVQSETLERTISPLSNTEALEPHVVTTISLQPHSRMQSSVLHGALAARVNEEIPIGGSSTSLSHTCKWTERGRNCGDTTYDKPTDKVAIQTSETPEKAEKDTRRIGSSSNHPTPSIRNHQSDQNIRNFTPRYGKCDDDLMTQLSHGLLIGYGGVNCGTSMFDPSNLGQRPSHPSSTVDKPYKDIGQADERQVELCCQPASAEEVQPLQTYYGKGRPEFNRTSNEQRRRGNTTTIWLDGVKYIMPP